MNTALDTMTAPASGSSPADRIRGALWGMFVGDALAMPAHWYYDVSALRRDFGVIRDYQPPSKAHPSSIMPLASTGRAGRGSQEGEVVGGVILKGKKHHWGRADVHYHQGMRPGDNTLNLLCTRVLLRTLNAVPPGAAYDPADYLRAYVAFMTAPDSHNDTYAESVHRDFFANFAKGVPPERCAGREGHDTASVGGLTGLPPVIFAALGSGDRAAATAAALAQLRLTHLSEKLDRYAQEFIGVLVALLRDPSPDVAALACEAAARLGFPARAVVEKMRAGNRADLHVIGGMVSSACYIEHSLPAVLYLAARYADDFEGALVANTNVGGDNCHRGAALGAILGAALGRDAIPARWIDGLTARAEIADEIERFVARYAAT